MPHVSLIRMDNSLPISTWSESCLHPLFQPILTQQNKVDCQMNSLVLIFHP